MKQCNSCFFVICLLLLLTGKGNGQIKYPDFTRIKDITGLPNRLPNNVMPVLACWFWTEKEFMPGGYKTFIDQSVLHSPYNLLCASIRLPGRETTTEAVHNQLKLAARYAAAHGIPLIADLDVRTARRAFESKYTDELQEMLLLQKTALYPDKSSETVITSKDLSDHYTGSTTHYIPLQGKLLRVYSYLTESAGIDPNSLEDITGNCTVVFSSKDSIRVRIPAAQNNNQACVLVSFTHLTPDVFAPHLMAFQREVIQQYADVPLAGVFKDEWGFPPCFDGSPDKNQFWYSSYRAQAYAEKTGGRDLLADCLLMHLNIKGKELERQMAINNFMEMSWQRNGALENDFYNTIKEVFGPDAVVTTHPTWYPYPDLREHMKNGLDWWVATRDWAQTDEYTPFAVRTALAKKWKCPIWYNMYYSSLRTDYEQSVWTFALAGGRINYHPIYPSNQSGIENHLQLLQGDLMRAESRVRLLNYISQSSLNCPVAVVFGHACTMNWAGPYYDDVGMELTEKLWIEGIPADLIPSSEIQNKNLLIDQEGWIRYGTQRYAVVVLYHPEYEKSSTAEFFHKAATGHTALYRMGDWTKDFNAEYFNGNKSLPEKMIEVNDITQIISGIKNVLKKWQIEFQTPAAESPGKKFDHVFVTPPTAGYCHLIDGTYIQVAGSKNVSGDSIRSKIKVRGYNVSFDAIGLFAVRLDENGHLQAMAAGGLKSFKTNDFSIQLDERLDMALWKNNEGKWEGVIQGLTGDIPLQLMKLTVSWTRIDLPVPLSE
jgi:hypothetical protein